MAPSAKTETGKIVPPCSLPTIIIQDADNNLVFQNTDIDFPKKRNFSRGFQFSRFNETFIKRDKLPTGSSAFQKVLNEINDEDKTACRKTSVIVNEYQLHRSKTLAVTDNSHKLTLGVERTNTIAMGRERLKPLASGTPKSCTKVGESKIKTKKPGTLNSDTNKLAGESTLKPCGTRQRRKSAPVLMPVESGKYSTSAKPTDARSVRWSKPRASVCSTDTLPTVRTRHLSDGSLIYRKGILKKTI